MRYVIPFLLMSAPALAWEAGAIGPVCTLTYEDEIFGTAAEYEAEQRAKASAEEAKAQTEDAAPAAE